MVILLLIVAVFVGVHAMKTAIQYQNKNQNIAYVVIMCIGYAFFVVAAIGLAIDIPL